MKLLAALPALITAAFLITTLGGVIYSESAVAEPKASCEVSWNKKKDQVKKKHRRKYIACLEDRIKAVGKSLNVVQSSCSVSWNKKKDQVKNKHRRKYIACLEVAATAQVSPDAPMKYNSGAARTPRFLLLHYSDGSPTLKCPDGRWRESSDDMCGMMADGTTDRCKNGTTFKAFSGDKC